MLEVCYFTDASLSSKIQQEFGGVFGFVRGIKTSPIDMNIDKVVIYRSDSNINSLESMAIHTALYDILNTNNRSNHYHIYTDSSCCYDMMKRFYLDKSNNKPSRLLNKLPITRTSFENSIISTYYKLDTVIQSGYSITLSAIKSHCMSPKEQIRSTKKQYGLVLSNDEARFICEGNRKIDELIRYYNHNWFFKYLQYVNPF